MFTGRVYKHTGSHYRVKDPATGEMLDCTVRGKLRLQQQRTTNPVAAGDRVTAHKTTATEGVITEVLPRTNCLVRRATNLSKQTHVIAANIDRAFLVVTIDFPAVQCEFVDRFLVSCEAYGVPVTIVVNKADLYAGTAQQAALEQFRQVYTGAGYEVLTVSARTGAGISALSAATGTRLSLLAGASGVGKSSLINALDPSLHLRTGPISDAHQTGMHTTTFYEMFDTAAGGQLIDSPGIRGFGLVDVAKNELHHFFPELFRTAAQCRFHMCTHAHEPGCAVKAAVAAGTIAAARYGSYLKMLGGEEGKYRPSGN